MNFRVLKKFWKSPRTSLFLKKGHEPLEKFSFLKICVASVLLSKAFGYSREECVCVCVCVLYYKFILYSLEKHPIKL